MSVLPAKSALGRDIAFHQYDDFRCDLLLKVLYDWDRMPWRIGSWMSRAEISDLTSLGEEAEIDCLLTLVARNYADRKGKTFRISGEGYAFVKKCLGEAADRPMEPAPDTYDD